MRGVTKRLEQLERTLLARGAQQDQGIDVSWMTPIERRERIAHLVGKMTDEEVDLFEKKHGVNLGYLRDGGSPRTGAC